MPDEPRTNPAADTLKEIERLQKASADALACYLEIQKRIALMQSNFVVQKEEPSP